MTESFSNIQAPPDLPPHLNRFVDLFARDLVPLEKIHRILYSLKRGPMDGLAVANLRRAFKVLFPDMPMQFRGLTVQVPYFPNFFTSHNQDIMCKTIGLWSEENLAEHPQQSLLFEFQATFGKAPSLGILILSLKSGDEEKRKRLLAKNAKEKAKTGEKHLQRTLPAAAGPTSASDASAPGPPGPRSRF